MSDRRIGNNRLIDGAKLDALSLNSNNKLNANNIADGTVTDNEFLQLKTLQADLINASHGTEPTTTNPLEKTDIKESTGTTVVEDDINKTIKLTYSDGTSTLFTEKSIVQYAKDGSLLTASDATGTYSTQVGQTYKIITYTDGTIVNFDGLGGIKVNNSNIAYINKINSFTVGQVFKDSVKFEETIVGDFEQLTYPVGSNTVTLDGRRGNVFKVGLTQDTNIKLNYLKEGAIYTLVIVKNGFKARITEVQGLTIDPDGTITQAPTSDGTYWAAGAIAPGMENTTSPVITLTMFKFNTAVHISGFTTRGVTLPSPF